MVHGSSFLVFVLLFNCTQAQVLPDSYQAGSKINYVRVWEANVAETNSNVLIAREMQEVTQTTQYFDGLGRTLQTNVKNGSLFRDPNQPVWEYFRDLVSSKHYDQLGREKYQYLPFITPYPSNGEFLYSPFVTQASYIQAQYPDEHYYYSQTDFEQSPLGRAKKSLAPGDSWVGSNRGVQVEYELNNGTEGIRIWNIDFASGSVPYSTTTFSAGKLSKTIILDDLGKKVYTYTDFEGRTILKKVQEKESGAGLDENSHVGWLCTYYVYDDLGQLRSTITPLAVKYLEQNSWAFVSNDVYQELCFWYEFDERGRAIIKHSSGAGQIHLVYDNKDRLVLSQDENQRNRSTKQWSFYLYDNLDRTIATGLYDNNASRETMETFVKGLNNGNVYISIYTGANETIKADNPVAGTSGYCNSCSNTVINNVNYYDDYNYTGVKNFNTNFSFAPTSNNSYLAIVTFPESAVTSLRTVGFSTGSKTRVINENFDDSNPNNDLFLTATTYYDDKGRSIQGLSDNVKNAVDYTTSQYDFSGKVLSVCEKHTMPGTSLNNYTSISKYEYDRLNRLLVLSKKIGDLDYKKIAQYDYDEMGRVKNKKLSPDYNSGAGIEKFKYDYNIRGWLNGINKDYATASTSLNQWDHFFGMYMGYDNRDNAFTTARYDGNLTGAIWKTQGDNMPRRYDYTYDNANRFTKALFLQKEKPTDASWNNAKMDFSVTDILYDENNNLKQMFQKGVIPGNNSPLYIDKLVYDYKLVSGGEWSNQLRRVFDQTTDLTATNNGALGDFKDESYGVNGEDYVFDANGNLVKDNNKKIRVGSGNGVVYNFMDKPQKITIENKSILEFIYDADGIKLGKKVTNTVTSTSKTTWYMGDFIYEEENSQVKLMMILHEEGRIRVYEPNSNPRVTQGGNFDLPDNTKGSFEFFVKDNLQSTRMVLTEETHSEINNCTMETANQSYEDRMFGQVDANGNPISGLNEVQTSRQDKQTVAPGWNSNTSTSVSRLRQSDQKLGPNTIMKVMAGDEISAYTEYYYTGPVDNSGSPGVLSTLLGSLFSTLSNTAPAGNLHGSAGTITNNYDVNPGDLGSFLNSQNGGGNATPQAYMNIMFFDENFNFVPYDNVIGLGSYGWRVVADGDGQAPLVAANIKVPKNGYAYIYLSNESQTNVFFDNFAVTHNRGRIAEENAYYPYGLKIKGLSAKAFDKGNNKYGYQGDFSEGEEETDWDEFDLRMYDAQIGRWTGVDPYDQFASPYIGMGDNPVNFIDPNGGSIGGWGAIFGAVGGFITGYSIARNNGESVGSSIGWGALSAFAGAGIGYGIAESISPGSPSKELYRNPSKRLWANIRSFYSGFFGGTDEVLYRAKGNFGNTASAHPPFIWNIEFPSLWIAAPDKQSWQEVLGTRQIWVSDGSRLNQGERVFNRQVGDPIDNAAGTWTVKKYVNVSYQLTTSVPIAPDTRTKIYIHAPEDNGDGFDRGMGINSGNFNFGEGAVDYSVNVSLVIDGKNQSPKGGTFYGISNISINVFYRALINNLTNTSSQARAKLIPHSISIFTERLTISKRQKLSILPFIKRKLK